MRVKFDPAASDDLDGVFAWVAKDNPRAAYELIARIATKVVHIAIGQVICGEVERTLCTPGK